MAKVKQEPETDVAESDSSAQSPGITCESCTITLRLPNIETARHVLQCAFNACTGVMATDERHSTAVIPYVRDIQKLLGKLKLVFHFILC